MECPQCGEEPIKVFGRLGGGVGIWKNLQGYVRCIECDTLLKMSLGKPFWVSLILFVTSFILSGLSILALYLSFEYDLFDPSIFLDTLGVVYLDTRFSGSNGLYRRILFGF